MTPATLAAIDLWASEWAPEGSEQFAAVVELCAVYRVQEMRIAELVDANERLCDRVSQQSELLGRRSEK